MPAPLHILAWLTPSALLAAATSGVRRRNVSAADPSDGGFSLSPSPGASPSGGRNRAAAVAAVAAVLVVAALAAVAAAGARDSWGNRWVLAWAHRTTCRPPTAAARPGAWGSLANFSHPIITKSPEAQQLFNQGLLLAFDYNREESQGAFSACLALDPAAAMCHWGLAYALGPYLNVVAGTEAEAATFPVFGPAEFEQAQASAQQALALAEQAVVGPDSSHLAQRELGYCRAAAARFAEGTHLGEGREQAERAYAEAMQALGQLQEDATALTLAAEALMNLVAWDFLDAASGNKRPEAAQAEALLLGALGAAPRHELALHLHVHLAEAGAQGAPEGERSADALAGLQPRMGHLLHMPSHLYIRVGRYHDAVAVNTQAYGADLAAAADCLRSYLPEHNLHMMLFAASMAGQLSVVEEWTPKMWALPETAPLSAWPGRERTILLLAQVRFARWDAVLATLPPTPWERGPGDPGGHGFALAMWHYSRCLALASRAERAQRAQQAAAAKRLRAEAEQELAGVERAVAALPPDVVTRPGQGKGIYSNDNNGLGAIAVQAARARLLALEGRWQEAAAELAAAAEAEQGLGYLEPPRLLHQPLLQCLGWAYLHWGRYEEAVEAYERDLVHNPGNGWSLLGLSQALMRSGRSAEAARPREAFEKVWRHADRQLASSCPAFAE